MDSPPNLFLRLGGETGLARMIDLQVERLIADDYLGEYFMGVDIDRLKSGLLAFLRKTFGDPGAAYRGTIVAGRASRPVGDRTRIRPLRRHVCRCARAKPARPSRIRRKSAHVLKAMRASVITEFKPNPAYDYQSKPF